MERPNSRASELIWTVMDGTALATGADFFPALVRHLASALRRPYAFVAECTNPRRAGSARWRSGVGQCWPTTSNTTSPARPAKLVIGWRDRYHPDDVQTRFPEDHDLVDPGRRSYLGVPLVAASGEILGHLAVLDNAPMPEDEVTTAVLRTFAARAGMELERLRASHRSPRSTRSSSVLPIARARCSRSTTPSSST